MDRGIRAARTFEDGIVVQSYAGGRYDVLVVGRAYPYSKIEANRSVKNIQNGDKVRLCISGRLVEIIGRDGANNVNSSVLPLGAEGLAYIQGLWPIAQANPTVDCMARYSNVLIIPSTSASSTSTTVGPGNSNYSPLGVVTFQAETSGAVTVIYHIKYDGELDNYTNTLTAISTSDLSPYWEISLGDPYASIPDSESVAGNRQGWLFHCPSTRLLWAVGFGSHTARKTIYVIPETGVPVTEVSSAESLQQSTLDYGHFVKGWFSPTTRPLLREETSDSIKALKLTGEFPTYAIGEAWNITVQDLLPDYDLATSAAPSVGAGGYSAEGRWPIDGARKTLFFWGSGSKKMTDSNTATVTQVYPTVSSAVMCGYTQTSDTKSLLHRAAIIALDLTTGLEKWQRVIEHTPSVTYDYAAIAAQEAADGLTIGDEIVGGTGVGDVYPFYDSTTGFYTNVFTYQGLAAEGSLTLSPTGPFTFPRCSVPFEGEPEYDNGSFYVVPWRGPDWGGVDVYTAPSACGTFSGPYYNYFAPGHVKLLPDNTTFAPTTPEYLWLESDDYVREDCVGGSSSADSAGWHWTAFSKQEVFVRSFETLQAEYLSQSETFVPSPSPEACGTYIDTFRYWNVWSIGIPEHSPKTILWGTSPDGNTQREEDISQYISQGTLQRGIRCNVYQIIALPDKDAVCIVRDWWGAFTDSGELEHHAYPVVEIRKRSDLSTLISRVEFFEDRTVYDAGTEEEPLITRTYDQYISPPSFQGKGSGHSSGPWIMWSHIVKNNVTNVNYCNKFRLYFENPGSTPTVYRNSTFVEAASGNVIDSIEKQHTVNYVDSYQICSSGNFDGTNWVIRKIPNQ